MLSFPIYFTHCSKDLRPVFLSIRLDVLLKVPSVVVPLRVLGDKGGCAGPLLGRVDHLAAVVVGKDDEEA